MSGMVVFLVGVSKMCIRDSLSARGKNGNKKPLLHGCVGFHVAAVYVVAIQLNFQNDTGSCLSKMKWNNHIK